MKLLVVVDYQNDFVGGSLGFPGAEDLGPRIAEKVRAYRAAGDLVAWTFDTHGSDYPETQEGRNLPVSHCMEGTPGYDLHPSVAGERRADDPTFRKPSFGSWELGEWLKGLAAGAGAAGEAGAVAGAAGAGAAGEAGADGASATGTLESIEFVGLVSNICVVTNVAVAKAACPEIPLIVDAACTASNDPQLNEAALDVMESIQVQVANRPRP